MTTKTLLAVDGNSLVHRSFHALINSNLRANDGRPTWAVKGFLSQLLGALERVGADGLIVGFDDNTSSVRKSSWPHYKATRKEKAPELGQQISLTAQVLREAGVHVVVPSGLEADDVLASAARRAAEAGWRTVIVTSDRDAFALIDETTSVLRLINGGVDGSPILTPDRLFTMNGIRPEQYREYAAMRGDTSDNLAGIRGIGEKTAAKLLAEFGTVAAAFADVDAGGAAVAAALGPACVTKLASPQNRSAFAENVAIMTMRTDLDLDGFRPQDGSGVLPLDPAAVGAALDGIQLASVRSLALRTLCGVGAPPQQVPVEPDWPAELSLLDDRDVPPPFDEEYYPADVASPPEPAYAGAPAPTFPSGASAAAAGSAAADVSGPAPAQRPALATASGMPGSSAPRPAQWDDTLF